MVSPPDPRASASQWNGYVDAGSSRDERRLRLEECPEEYRESVADHVRTAFLLALCQRIKREENQK